MTGLKLLPRLMVAPNGARRTRADHPALPITIDETVATARKCFEAGADGIHIHVRDETGKHTLDSGLYKEALAELKKAVPSMGLQITTEAVGIYSPHQQRQVVKDVKPDFVSISISEMLGDNDAKAAMNFYQWCADTEIAVQHILYGHKDLELWENCFKEISFQNSAPQVLFVLGRYAHNQESNRTDLNPFLDWILKSNRNMDWAVCAFGRGETDCLAYTLEKGGKVRVGFENSLWNHDGSIAKDNAQRVTEIVELI